MGGCSLGQGRGAMGEQRLSGEARLDNHPEVVLGSVLQLTRGAVGYVGQCCGLLGQVHQETRTGDWLAGAHFNLPFLVGELGNQVDDTLGVSILQLSAANLTVVNCLRAVGDCLVHMAQEGGATGGEG